ncbi:MAG TPA: hypothetical protein VIL28_13430 [Steroidobacteraceae bacterium]
MPSAPSPASSKSLLPLALVATSFTVLALTIIGLAAFGVVTFQLALLLLVGQVGVYFGCGVLVLIYRFVGKLH